MKFQVIAYQDENGNQVLDLHTHCVAQLYQHKTKSNMPSWCLPRKVKIALRWLEAYDKNISKGHAHAGINR
jgi:hypothetical protein